MFRDCCKRAAQRQTAASARPVVVLRRPARSGVYVPGCAYDRVGREAVFNRSSIDERFETRAGLALCLSRIIEFASRKIVSADHRADFACFRLDADQRPVNCGQLVKVHFQGAFFFIDFGNSEYREVAAL